LLTIIGRGPLAKELATFLHNKKRRIVLNFTIKNLFEKKETNDTKVVIFCADTDNFFRSTWLNLVFSIYAMTRKDTKVIYLTTVNSLKFMGDREDFKSYFGLDYYSFRRSFLNKLVKRICYNCELQFVYLPIVIGKKQNWSRKLQKLHKNNAKIMLPKGIKNKLRIVGMKSIAKACCNNQGENEDFILYDRKIPIENLFIEAGCIDINYYSSKPRSNVVSVLILIAKVIGLPRRRRLGTSKIEFTLDQRLERYLIGK